MKIKIMRIRYIDGGHEADINVADFDEDLHALPAEPAQEKKPASKPAKPKPARKPEKRKAKRGEK